MRTSSLTHRSSLNFFVSFRLEFNLFVSIGLFFFQEGWLVSMGQALQRSNDTTNSSSSFKTDNGALALHEAAKKGDVAMIQALLKSGESVNVLDDMKKTALMWACIEGQADAINALCINGASIDAHDKRGYTPLYLACEARHVSAVEILLAYGASISTGLKGCSPLHSTAISGRTEIATLLITHGSDIDEKAKQNAQTSLHFAAQNVHKELVELLVSEGANKHIQNKHNETPFDVALSLQKWAAENENDDLEMRVHFLKSMLR